MSIDFPQKNKKRALRRKEKHNKVDRAREIAHQLFPDLPVDKEWEEQWAVRHADNMKSCACWMCQNPRRWSKKSETLQEKKFKESPWCD